MIKGRPWEHEESVVVHNVVGFQSYGPMDWSSLWISTLERPLLTRILLRLKL